MHPRDLAEAWRSLLFRARMSKHHRVTREELSVREHMSQILRQLKESRVLEFTELFDPAQGVAVLVVTFLALLELARRQPARNRLLADQLSTIQDEERADIARDLHDDIGATLAPFIAH